MKISDRVAKTTLLRTDVSEPIFTSHANRGVVPPTFLKQADVRYSGKRTYQSLCE